MAIDSKLLGAWGQEKHTVLECELRPFSLWHAFLLEAIDSPFLREGVVHWRDLALAVAICQMPYDCTPQKSLLLDWWGWNWWRFYFGKGWFAGEVAAFIAYIGAYFSAPDYAIISESSNGSRPRGRRGQPHAILQKACDLIGWSHWSEATVWELPVGKADWYQAMIHKAAGLDVDFLTDEQRAEQAELRAELAAEAALREGKEADDGTR